MLASSTWSAAGARPPRPRPTSAKPTTSRKVLSARPELVSYSKNNDLEEEDEDEEVVEDDDGDDDGGEFGDAAEREHKLRQQVSRQQPKQQRRHWSGKVTLPDAKFRSKPKFRPSSAPAGRPKSASIARNAQDDDDKPKRSAASISIAYLRAAAEKKKARDREFARELFREENEFKKKISVKIDQANKMMAATGSAKSFGPAPDRDGIHMIKVTDPVGGDRVISVEIFHILLPFR
ncbi:beta-glucosidase btgE [Phytophthora cinnamomi]|uniref:beta-glucosidase btgE n=1 Tax=Phytophthora cinnamomi TaxID=4785 RepID=UPI003559B5C1|nr:beta-glucosidase btgE [Phytophthora cinnamomi]